MTRRFVAVLSVVVVVLGVAVAGPALAGAPGGGRPGGRRGGLARAVHDQPAAGPARGRGRDAGVCDRLRGRALLRQRLAHHRRDGRRVDAAAQAGRRRVVRSGRPVGRARRRSSPAAGATPATTCRPPPACSVARTDFVPDGRRGALFGLTITNPGAARTAKLTVDAHSELMGQYPWGFTGVTPERQRQHRRQGQLRRPAARSSPTTARCPGRRSTTTRPLVGTALKPDVGIDRRPVLGPAARPSLHRHRAGRAGRPQAVAVRRRTVRHGAPAAS